MNNRREFISLLGAAAAMTARGARAASAPHVSLTLDSRIALA
jgi:hypothetical protein